MQKILSYNMRFIIKQRKNAGIKHYNDPSAFIKCSNSMDHVYLDNISLETASFSGASG